MSTVRRCEFFKATDGQWYVSLGDYEHAYEDHQCTNYGPYASLDAAESFVFDNFSNPGGYGVNDSGTIEVPSELGRNR